MALERERQLQQQLEEERRLLAQQRLEAQAAAARQRERMVQALAEQRQVFGASLMRPFEASEVRAFQRDASVFRFAVGYLGHLMGQERLLRHCEKWPRQLLIARRCWHCGKPLLCLNSMGYVEGDWRAYGRMVEYFKPEEGKRGYLISVCLHCGRRQKRREQYEGSYVELYTASVARWLQAFRP